MHDSTSETSIYSQDISAFPGVQTSGIFVIEFLLTGSVYCYGFYYPTLSKADSLHKNELWFPVGFLALTFITNSWNAVLCQYLIRKRYEFSGISIFVCLLALGKILALLLKDNFIKFFIHGCFEGTCVSVTLKLLEKSTIKCFQNRQRFAFTSALGRLLGLFTIPHLLQASITNIGVFYTGLLHATVLLNVIPTGWIIFKASIIDVKLTKHITMTRLNNENNITIENMDGHWLGEDVDVDQDDDETEYTKCLSNTGVEILPVIYEEDEEQYIYSKNTLNFNRKSENRKKQRKRLKIYIFYFTSFLCIIITIINKLILSVTLFTYLFITSHMSLPTQTNHIFKNILLTLTASSWIITSITIYCSVSKILTKLLYFLIGLTLLIISFYVIQLNSYDYRKALINSIFLGVEFGIIFSLVEDTSRYFLKCVNMERFKFIVNFLSGLLLLLLYVLTYIFFTFNLETYLSIIPYIMWFNLIIFIVIFIYMYVFDVFSCIKTFIINLSERK